MEKVKNIMYIVTTIVIPIATYLYGKSIKIKDNNTTQNEALKSILKSNLVNQYYVYKSVGKVPKFVKEAWYTMYESYISLGGNSFVRDDIKPKWDKLDIEE